MAATVGPNWVRMGISDGTRIGKTPACAAAYGIQPTQDRARASA
jgi:hypothetical protein